MKKLFGDLQQPQVGWVGAAVLAAMSAAAAYCYYPEDIKLNQLPSRPHASSISNLLMMEEIFDRALIRLHSFHDGGY